MVGSLIHWSAVLLLHTFFVILICRSICFLISIGNSVCFANLFFATCTSTSVRSFLLYRTSTLSITCFSSPLNTICYRSCFSLCSTRCCLNCCFCFHCSTSSTTNTHDCLLSSRLQSIFHRLLRSLCCCF